MIFYEEYEAKLWRAELTKEGQHGACYVLLYQLEQTAQKALSDALRFIDSAGDDNFLRRVLFLRRVKGASYIQIGVEMGLSDESIRYLYKRQERLFNGSRAGKDK